MSSGWWCPLGQDLQEIQEGACRSGTQTPGAGLEQSRSCFVETSMYPHRFWKGLCLNSLCLCLLLAASFPSTEIPRNWEGSWVGEKAF